MTLNPPRIIEELSYDGILAGKISDLIARQPSIGAIIALESETLRKLLESKSYSDLLFRGRVNDAARASLLMLAGGSDLDHIAVEQDIERMVGESDARLRERVLLSVKGRQSGGTAERYRLAAMNVSLQVADAVAWCDIGSPVVHVAVRAADNNGIATASLLKQVDAALNHPLVKMVSDRIEVSSAVTQVTTVVARAWLLPSASNIISDLPEILQEAWAQEGGLGFDLTRAWLTARLMQPGVQRIEIISPLADIVVSPTQAIAITSVNIQYMGRDV